MLLGWKAKKILSGMIDCGDVVINVMQQEAREFYDLESLWGEATLISA